MTISAISLMILVSSCFAVGFLIKLVSDILDEKTKASLDKRTRQIKWLDAFIIVLCVMIAYCCTYVRGTFNLDDSVSDNRAYIIENYQKEKYNICKRFVKDINGNITWNEFSKYRDCVDTINNLMGE